MKIITISQTRWQSIQEQCTNIVVGYTINILANIILFPLFGWAITLEQNLLLGVFYTFVSFVRGYGLRRYYNWRHTRAALEKAQEKEMAAN